MRHAQEWIAAHQDEVDGWLAAAVAAYEAAGVGPVSPTTSSGTDQAVAGESLSLRVATKTFEPLVIYDVQTRQYTGFSIELWDEIADELEVEYELYGVNSVAKLLDEVERGSADIATAGIGITSTREQVLDFSHAFFESGLQIMVADDSGLLDEVLIRVLATLFTIELLYILGFLIVVLLGFCPHYLAFGATIQPGVSQRVCRRHLGSVLVGSGHGHNGRLWR